MTGSFSGGVCSLIERGVAIFAKACFGHPSYRNLAEFTTIGSAIIKLNDNNYRLQISIINHADFEQHFVLI
jgi:hypothetical protein